MLITRISIISGVKHTLDIPITPEEYEVYLFKVACGIEDKIQREFPNLNADQKEFLFSGITPEEWAEMFPDEDE